MTEQEINEFIESENVRIGDTLRFNYSYGMFPQLIRGKLFLKDFILGGRVINTKLGSLNLPEAKNYLILHNNINGLFSVSATFISNLEVESKRAINANEFNQFVKDNNVKKGDEIVIIEIDNRIFKTKIVDANLRIDEDGDKYFLLELNDEIHMFFLQSISEIKKI